MTSYLDRTTRPPTLHLVGHIDESADFSKIECPESGALVIDLSEIPHLNSIGLRTWAHWIASLKKLSPIFFRKCTPSVINQVNVLEGFLPKGAVVESFYVPYYCEPCNKGFDILAERGKDFREATAEAGEHLAIASAAPCPNCGQPAPSDIIEGKYYRFLKTKR